ncbi:MAG: YggT family protein [Acidimicrobiales bacterium]
MDLICTLLNLYLLVIFARILFSWIRVEPGTPVASIYSVVYNLTEPVLGPLRQVIPPVRLGMAALDLSPLILLVGIRIIC